MEQLELTFTNVHHNKYVVKTVNKDASGRIQMLTPQFVELVKLLCSNPKNCTCNLISRCCDDEDNHYYMYPNLFTVNIYKAKGVVPALPNLVEDAQKIINSVNQII